MKLLKYINIVLYICFVFFITGCEDEHFTGEMTWEVEKPDYQGTCTMIRVPVPDGGITFPVGIDDDTATIYSAFYLGETTISFGLYQAVCFWAEKEKTGIRYTNLYYPDYQYPSKIDNMNSIFDYPICGVTYFELLVWCNAYTEWYNEKYGTNFTPVYTESSGTPIRNAKKAYSPTYMGGYWLEGVYFSNAEECFETYYKYLSEHPKMEDYLNNIETSGTGFRLPTPNEWELAARWRGDDSTNSVTNLINGIDFSNQPVKFTKGNSVSGANDWVGNLNESHQYAVFEYNSRGKLFLSKTKKPNTLGFYDMCGNLREYVYNVIYIEVISNFDTWGNVIAKAPYPFAATRGGYFEDVYEQLTINYTMFVDATAYNYYYGFRVARSID